MGEAIDRAKVVTLNGVLLVSTPPIRISLIRQPIVSGYGPYFRTDATQRIMALIGA
jgi:hypothetical protein